jgi:signal transduction histidine kinase
MMAGKIFASITRRAGMFFHSIRFRLVAWFAVILTIVLFVFSIFVFFNQSRDIQADAQQRLERKIATLEVTLTFTSNGVVFPQGILQDTDVLVFLSPNGQVLASQGPIPAEAAVQLAARAQQERGRGPNRNSPEGIAAWSEWATSARTTYIFATIPYIDVSGRTGLVILGSPADPYGLVNRLLFTLAAGSLLTLLVALLGGYWLADRAMRPVHTITQAARTIGETDLSLRLNMTSKDELGELANTFDGMLGRLQAAFERQRQFVADASHELRTPLTIVNLEAGRALTSKRSGEEYKKALAIIRSENDFMTSLVNDLLVLARMDAGQAVLEKVPVDLSEVVVDTVERLAPLAARNGVRLETGELPEACISGDRQYLLQMVSNLVENGIKYTRGKEKRVSIETGAADGNVWVRVADNGPGIAPEHLPHLFDRFYRVDASRTRAADDPADPKSPSGSGLGLSIVQRIAQSIGGQIRVESTVGVGTTFEARFSQIN